MTPPFPSRLLAGVILAFQPKSTLANQRLRTMSIRKFGPLAVFCLLAFGTSTLLGSEADIKIPDLTQVKFDGLGGISGKVLMYLGILLCFLGAFALNVLGLGGYMGLGIVVYSPFIATGCLLLAAIISWFWAWRRGDAWFRA